MATWNYVKFHVSKCDHLVANCLTYRLLAHKME